MKFYFLLLLVVGCGGEQVQVEPEDSVRGLNAWTWSRSMSCNPSWIKKNNEWETCVATIKANETDNNECSLYSKYWSIGRSDVNIIYINIHGSGVYCSGHRYRCSPNLDFKVYIGSVGGADRDDQYKTISRIPNKPKPDSDPRFYGYNEIYPVNVYGSTAVRLLFYTTYFCGQINGANVYYYTCPSISKQLVKFSPQNAPNEQNSPSEIVGKCVDNSVQLTDKLYMNCYYNGSSTVYGKCACNKGYQIDGDHCKECTGITFKAKIGNEKCKPCGKNTQVVERKSCKCDAKYFREIGKEKENEADCYRPPSAPSIKTIRNITEDSAIVEFNELTREEIGDGSPGTYILNFTKNSQGSISMISKTSFKITDLGSYTTSFFTIYVSNNVTKLTGHSNSLKFNFTTARGGKITDFQVINNSDESITLTWKAPSVARERNLEFVVKYGDHSTVIKCTSIAITGGILTTKYVFKIYAQYLEDGKLIKGEVFTSEEITIKGEIPLVVKVIGISGVVVIITLVTIIVVLCVRGRRQHLMA